MNKKLIIIFFSIMMIFALSCKKKRLNNDLCDCGDSQTYFDWDTVGLIIPNIITPNGDARNDRWEIDRIEYFNNVEVTIVDEGLINAIVFHSIGYEKMWDGTRNGKKLKDGKYFYEINFDGHTATGYVCIFTVMDLKHDYWDCLRKCAPMEGMDPLLDY